MKLLKLFLILSVSSTAFGAAEKKDNKQSEIEALQEDLKKLTLQVASLQKTKHVSGEMAANPAQQAAPNQPAAVAAGARVNQPHLYKYVVKTTKEDGCDLKITKMEDLTSGAWFQKTVRLVTQGSVVSLGTSEDYKGSPQNVEILRKLLVSRDELTIAAQVLSLVNAFKRRPHFITINDEEIPAYMCIQLISHGDPSYSTIINE